jgi:peroxiredoxin
VSVIQFSSIVGGDAARVGHLIAGLPVPPIALPSSQGGQLTLAALAGLTVAYLYPYAGRPGLPNPPNWDYITGAHGSTPQAEGFRASQGEYDAMGVRVVGISGQSPTDQSEVSLRLGLTFALLSDSSLRFASALDLPTFATGGVTYLSRLTLIVRDGRILRTMYPITDPARHASDVLAVLKKLGTDAPARR